MVTKTMRKTGEPCAASRARECPHIQESLINVRVADQKEKWEWIKHADEHFAGPKSEHPHKGNASEMIRTYVRLCLKKQEDGTLHELFEEPDEQNAPDTVLANAEMRNELEKLRTRNTKLKQQLSEARGDVVHFMARPRTDEIATEIGFLVSEILQKPRTLEETAMELRQHGVDEYIKEFQTMDSPPKPYDKLFIRNIDTLIDLADVIIEELVENGFVEVQEKNERYYYETTSTL